MSLMKLLVAAGCMIVAGNLVAAESAALAKLQGRWQGKRTNSEGREATATIEIKGEKLTFQLFDGEQLRLIAKGNVKAEKHGPFNVLTITGIEGGRLASELEATGDDRSTVYFLKAETLTLASNFDKDRENEKPRVETYQRVESKAAATPSDASKLAGKWKMTAKLGEDERDYEMNLAEADGKLSGTLISPRSGEHKFKSVTFSSGKLSMELPREIQGNDVTFLYTGELTVSELSGSVTVKGYEDQFTGSWTAKK